MKKRAFRLAILAAVLFLYGCSGELSPTEKRLTGGWNPGEGVEKSNAIHFFKDRTFLTASSSGVFKPVSWHADEKKIYLTYHVNADRQLPWILKLFMLLPRKVEFKILTLNDSVLTYETRKTKLLAARLISMKRVIRNGKFVRE